MFRSKLSFYILAGIACFILTSFQISAAATPGLMSYQGRLTNSGGTPLNGFYNMTFSIYNAPTGGSAIWTETQNVAVIDGLFTVSLGSVTPIDNSVFTSTECYLGITVNSDPEMTPRSRIEAAGYAYRVSSVDSAHGGFITTSTRGYSFQGNAYVACYPALSYSAGAVIGGANGASSEYNIGVQGNAINSNQGNYGVYAYGEDSPGNPSFDCAGLYAKSYSRHGGTVWGAYIEGDENVTGNVYGASEVPEDR